MAGTPDPAPVAIFGDGLDLHVIAVEEALATRGIPATLYPPAVLLNGTHPAWKLGHAPRPRSAWLYRLPSPVLSNATGPDDILALDAPRGSLGLHLAALALAWEWGAQGVPLVNPPGAGPGAQNKPWQLGMLAHAGIAVPPTVLCVRPGDVAEAVRTLGGAGDCVAKPLWAGWHARLIRSDDESVPLPCLVQPRVFGVDVRVTVVAGRAVSCVRLGTEHLDYRSDPRHARGELPYHPMPVDSPAARAAERACAALSLVFAGVDLKQGDDGTITILEANPAPAFLDIQERCQHPIAQALATVLAG